MRLMVRLLGEPEAMALRARMAVLRSAEGEQTDDYSAHAACTDLQCRLGRSIDVRVSDERARPSRQPDERCFLRARLAKLRRWD